jgi:hypothetical protein
VIDIELLSALLPADFGAEFEFSPSASLLSREKTRKSAAIGPFPSRDRDSTTNPGARQHVVGLADLGRHLGPGRGNESRVPFLVDLR